MKKLLLGLFSVATASATAISLASCGSKETDGSVITADATVAKAAQASVFSKKALELGLVASQHNTVLNDDSFNELIFNGMVAAISGSDINFKDASGTSYSGKTADDATAAFISMPTEDTSTAIAAAYTAAFNNKNTIVLGGFQHIDALNNYSIPDNKAAILWGSNIAVKNAVGVSMKMQQNSFLGGIVAGFYLNNHKEKFGNELKVGGWAGLDIPDLLKYLGGLQQGIKWFNENIIPNKDKWSDLFKANITPKKVEWIDLGNRADNFSGGFAPGGATAIADKLVSKGADLLFPVAGAQTQDAKKSIKSHNSHAEIIGVDLAMEENATWKDIVPFSVVNDISGLTDLIKGVHANPTTYLGTSVFGSIRASGTTTIKALGVSHGHYDSDNDGDVDGDDVTNNKLSLALRAFISAVESGTATATNTKERIDSVFNALNSEQARTFEW